MMNFRALKSVSTLASRGVAAAAAPVVAAAPQRAASFLRKDFQSAEDLASPVTDSLASTHKGDAGAARAGYQNTIESMPRPELQNPIVPLDWQYLSREQRMALFKKQLATAEQAGELLDQVMDTVPVGDAAKIAQRKSSVLERQGLIGLDNFRVNITPTMRGSPIYKNVEHVRQRTPRVPLPSDMGTDINPTAGLLHLYRLHHAKMFLRQEERRVELEKTRAWVDINAVDIKFGEIPGADVAEMDKIMEYVRHNLRMFSGVAPSERVKVLLAVKELLPSVVRIEKHVEVKKRRRRN